MKNIINIEDRFKKTILETEQEIKKHYTNACNMVLKIAKQKEYSEDFKLKVLKDLWEFAYQPELDAIYKNHIVVKIINPYVGA